MQTSGIRGDASGIPGTLIPLSRQVPTTGFSIAVAVGTRLLLLDPAGTLATGTITMPAAPGDGERLRIASSQTVTSLTMNPAAGQTLKGALTTIAANGFAEWEYVSATSTWYRIG